MLNRSLSHSLKSLFNSSHPGRSRHRHRSTLQSTRKYAAIERLEDRTLLSCASAPAGIVSCWSGDGNPADSINGNDGTLDGGATFGSGQVNQAFNFDGIDDSVRIPDVGLADLDGFQELTIVAWINPRQTDGVRTIVSKYDSTDKFTYTFKVENGRLRGLAGTGGPRPLGLRFIVANGPFINTNEWTHVAMVWKGGDTSADFEFYKNGQLGIIEDLFIGTDGPVAMANSTVDVHIGATSGAGTSDGRVGPLWFFDGLIDEVEIYNRALSASELQARYQDGIVTTVEIDIKPGSNPNSINLGSKGTIPVAIFSTATFDATTIDPLTVTLAEAKIRLRGKGTPMASKQDVNGDGLLDLVVHVETEALQLTATDTLAELSGKTFDGVSFQGFDTIRVVAALHVAGGPAEDVIATEGLTDAALNSVVEQALAYWTAAGVEPHQIDALTQLDVQIADLPDSLLGIAALNIVWIDRDAAGYGWSVNSGGVDLFSAVIHEFAHVLGFEHSDDGVMAETLAISERHLPGEEYHSEALVISVFDLNNQDDSTSNDSLGTGIIASPQSLAEKFDYALENDFDTSMTDDDLGLNEPVPYLPEEDLDADSFFSEFAESLLDDLLTI